MINYIGHSVYRPHPLDDGVLGNKAVCTARWNIVQHWGLLVALNRALQDSVSVCLTLFLHSHLHTHSPRGLPAAALPTRQVLSWDKTFAKYIPWPKLVNPHFCLVKCYSSLDQGLPLSSALRSTWESFTHIHSTHVLPDLCNSFIHVWIPH